MKARPCVFMTGEKVKLARGDFHSGAIAAATDFGRKLLLIADTAAADF